VKTGHDDHVDAKTSMVYRALVHKAAWK
jgi:hypothetical protein